MMCSLCNKRFHSETAYDAHRTGDWPNGGWSIPIGMAAKARRCLTDLEMVTAGLMQDAKGVWMWIKTQERMAA